MPRKLPCPSISLKKADLPDRSWPKVPVSVPSFSVCLPCPKQATLSYERRPNLNKEKWYSIGPSNGCHKILPIFVHDGCTFLRGPGTPSRTPVTIDTATLGGTTFISSSSTPSMSTVRSSTPTDHPDSNLPRPWSKRFDSLSTGRPKTSRSVSSFHDQPNLAKEPLFNLRWNLTIDTQRNLTLYSTRHSRILAWTPLSSTSITARSISFPKPTQG
jgi:hypothetical protein